MHAFIYVSIGALVGWIATLFSDAYDWKPTSGDLLVAALSAWLGGAVFASFDAVPSALWPLESILGCLAFSVMGVIAWRVAQAWVKQGLARKSSSFPRRAARETA